MARYTLYGNDGNNSTTSTPTGSSNAFTVSNKGSSWGTGVENPTKPVHDYNNGNQLDSNIDKYMIKNAYMEYESIDSELAKLHKTLGITDDGASGTFNKNTKYYNRFKLPTLNDAFQKGFAHVFFVRPDCNILSSNGNALNSKFKNNPNFYYAMKNSPEMVKQLCLNNGQYHDFMLSISNKAASFSLSDEYINADTYGKTYSGWKIAFGRNSVESKTAGDFSVTYNDDRNLHVYHLHKLWVDYISGVYQGRYAPKSTYIKNHILDYASACYYIVTAEDGESIVFWSKYYGVFPTTIPSTQYSWAYGNTIQNPQIEIKYMYSFKEDYNPNSLVELNMNSGVGSGGESYAPIYDPALGHVGSTWVGAPYVELVTNSMDNDGRTTIPESPYTFKLRFRKA